MENVQSHLLIEEGGYSNVQLGNFALIRPLGEGGSARVYLGKHIHLGRLAAVKVLRKRVTHDQIVKLRQEAQILARLQNPFIVRIWEFSYEGANPFLAMEYAQLGSLRQYYPTGARLPLKTILLYVKQIAHALQYMHKQGYIHQDIKPDNILLRSQDHVLLSDFGIAAQIMTVHERAQHERAGTAYYMAPEQIRGWPSPASDLYSVAVMTYEWLTGHPPFQGSAMEILSQHLYTEPTSPREWVESVPEEVAQVVIKGLAKRPEERYRSVWEYASALERAIGYAQQREYMRGSRQPAPRRSAPVSEPLLAQPVQRPQQRPPKPASHPLRFMVDLGFSLVLSLLLTQLGIGAYALLILALSVLSLGLVRARPFKQKGLAPYILVGLVGMSTTMMAVSFSNLAALAVVHLGLVALLACPATYVHMKNLARYHAQRKP